MAIKIGISGCLIGQKCNFNGEDLLSSFLTEINNYEDIEFVSFCPEDFVFGTPRPNLRIVGGNGNDVLIGKAQVIDENDKNVTVSTISGAEEFVKILKSAGIQYVFLMDGSPSCGSSILLNDKKWRRGGFKKGIGVTAALIKQAGIKVFSSFDEKDISEFLKKHAIDIQSKSKLKNLRDNPKFKEIL